MEDNILSTFLLTLLFIHENKFMTFHILSLIQLLLIQGKQIAQVYAGKSTGARIQMQGD